LLHEKYSAGTKDNTEYDKQVYNFDKHSQQPRVGDKGASTTQCGVKIFSEAQIPDFNWKNQGSAFDLRVKRSHPED
jgi:hypothetical protein